MSENNYDVKYLGNLKREGGRVVRGLVSLFEGCQVMRKEFDPLVEGEFVGAGLIAEEATRSGEPDSLPPIQHEKVDAYLAAYVSRRLVTTVCLRDKTHRNGGQPEPAKASARIMRTIGYTVPNLQALKEAIEEDYPTERIS